jgi:hypothetical protein
MGKKKIWLNNSYFTLRNPTILSLFQIIVIRFTLSYKFFLRSEGDTLFVVGDLPEKHRLVEVIPSSKSLKHYCTGGHRL